MKVKIYRKNPDTSTDCKFNIFEVPVPEKINWTIMDVLDYIALNLDSSVSYFKHSACNHGVCMRCVLRVNGKPKLACTCIANQYDAICLEPLANREVVKDLVTIKKTKNYSAT